MAARSKLLRCVAPMVITLRCAAATRVVCGLCGLWGLPGLLLKLLLGLSGWWECGRWSPSALRRCVLPPVLWPRKLWLDLAFRCAGGCRPCVWCVWCCGCRCE